jgi:hypothetical protein
MRMVIRMNEVHRGIQYLMLGHLGLVAVVINIILLSMLLYIYLENYRKLKSKFTAGLIFFASIFLIQNVLWIFFIVFVRDMRTPGMGLPNFILTIVETIGLGILLKITWE